MPRVTRLDSTSNTANSVGSSGYRRRRASKRGSKTTVAQLEKQIRRLARETKPEKKWSAGATVVRTAREWAGASCPTFVEVPAQGPGINERIGDHIRAKSVDYRIKLRSNTPASVPQSLDGYPSGAAAARFLVFRVKDQSQLGSDPPISYFFGASPTTETEITRPINPLNNDNFTVLHDEVFYLGVPQPSEVNTTTSSTNTNRNYMPDGLPLGIFSSGRISLNMTIELSPAGTEYYTNGLFYTVLTDNDLCVEFLLETLLHYTDA